MLPVLGSYRQTSVAVWWVKNKGLHPILVFDVCTAITRAKYCSKCPHLFGPRTCLLIWVIQAMGCSFILEQPRSSMLIWHPRIREVLRSIPKALVVDMLAMYLVYRSTYRQMPCSTPTPMDTILTWLPSGSCAGILGILVDAQVWGVDSETPPSIIKCPYCGSLGPWQNLHEAPEEAGCFFG